MLVQKTGKETIKYINKQNILNTFWGKEEVAKTEVIASTNLSAATVSALVQELMEEGFIQECRIGESSGGRRPVMYTLNRGLAYILTVQVMTKGIRMGVVDLAGNVMECQMIPETLHGKEALQEALPKAIRSFLDAHPEKKEKIASITISVPGVVDYSRCVLIYSAALAIEELDLKALIKSVFSHRKKQPSVYLFKDTDALVLGEMACAQDERRNMAYILCENGVGMSVVLHGSLFIGNSCGMELGHTAVDLHGEFCKCGAKGCLGVLLGEQAAVKHYIQLYEQQKTEWSSDPMFLTYEDIVELYLDDDPIAQQVIDNQLKILAVAIVNVVNLFNPKWVVIGGPLAKLSVVEEQVAQEVKRKVLKPFAGNLQVTTSKIGVKAALLGMANYTLRKEFFRTVRC